jgi:hypothetical protein
MLIRLQVRQQAKHSATGEVDIETWYKHRTWSVSGMIWWRSHGRERVPYGHHVASVDELKVTAAPSFLFWAEVLAIVHEAC